MAGAVKNAGRPFQGVEIACALLKRRSEKAVLTNKLTESLGPSVKLGLFRDNATFFPDQ
jgi:hypothetical protein